MGMIIFLVAMVLLLDLAALKGWAPDTRDGRDWTTADAHPHRRGPIATR